MKLLVLTTFYPEKNRNDLVKDTSIVKYFAQEWCEEGHDVTVLHLYAHNFKNILRYSFRKYGKFQNAQMDGKIKLYLMENQFFIKNARKYLKIQQKNIVKQINHLLSTELKDYELEV